MVHVGFSQWRYRDVFQRSGHGAVVDSPAGVIGSGNTASFTFSVGLGDSVNDLITSLTDPNTGLITEHDNSLNDQISNANNRASEMQTRVNDYHDRLVNQFAAMETAMNTMKTQEANMISALGGSTTTTS